MSDNKEILFLVKQNENLTREYNGVLTALKTIQDQFKTYVKFTEEIYDIGDNYVKHGYYRLSRSCAYCPD
jgi:hypothetical protein